jgi:hypothetical protein
MSFWSNPVKATKSFFGVKAPPRVSTEAPESQQIANKIPPINFASIMDSLSGDKLDIIRGTDGKVSLTFGNNSGRIDLNRPVDAGNINVRQIRGRNIDERAVEVIALSQAMTRLGGVIEQMENTSPYLIAQNQDLINSYRTAVSSALDRGFDFKQQAIDQKLTKMGLINSSTSFGVQVALAREKANAYAEMELKQAELAQGLKQQAIGNLHKRGEQLNQQANTELNRFGVETSNQLQVRSQDMQADLATQQLELQANEQRINTDFANKSLIENRVNRMTELGLGLFNKSSEHALTARSIENTAIANNNLAENNRFKSIPVNPWKKFAYDQMGSLGGKMAGKAFDKIFDDKKDKRAPWSPEPIDF